MPKPLIILCVCLTVFFDCANKTDPDGPRVTTIIDLDEIENTIEKHMEMQKRLRSKGIKILSLFFIDRVANYQDEDGIIKVLFDEAFNKIKKRFPDFSDRDNSAVYQ